MRAHLCRIAEKNARRHPNCSGRFRLCAIVTQGSRIYSIGFNLPRPSNTFPSSIHAEDAALRRLPVMDSGDLYVCRLRADGSLAMSKPCPGCMTLIIEKGIDTVHYTDPNGQWQSFEILQEMRKVYA